MTNTHVTVLGWNDVSDPSKIPGTPRVAEETSKLIHSCQFSPHVVEPKSTPVLVGGKPMIRIGSVALAFAACISTAWAQSSPDRGKYLVEGVMTCGNCHSPEGPGKPTDPARLYSGFETFDTPAFKVTAPNITPDPETGIGKWSDAEIKRALQEGVRPGGVKLAAMPWPFYKVLTPGDLDSIVAYLRSLKPLNNAVPAPTYKAPFVAAEVPDAGRPMSDADLRDPVKRGFYLVTIGHCMLCHTPAVRGRQDFVNDLGKGGREFPGYWGISVSRNITSHKEKGLGGWTDAEIKRAIAKGIHKDGTTLKPPMGFAWYARISEPDLDAIVTYLRTLPAKE
jgi:mono/diheme cytochrome c family protein